MHHSNDSQSSSSGQKSYVSQVPGAIRDLEIDGGAPDMDLGHLLDAPIVAPLPPPANSTSPTESPKSPAETKSVPKRSAPAKAGRSKGRPSFPWKATLLLLIVAAVGLGVAYEKTDVVKGAMKQVEGLFEEEGPPEVAVDENPLLREHGARILVASSPPGAKVYLDGKEQGVSPVALTGLMPGQYRVRVEAPGFASWSSRVDVGHGETAGVTARLLGKMGGATPGAFGRVRIETTPPADVYLAGDLLGRTPMETVFAPLGGIRLDFELPNGNRVSRNAEVKKDGVTRLRFDLLGER